MKHTKKCKEMGRRRRTSARSGRGGREGGKGKRRAAAGGCNGEVAVAKVGKGAERGKERASEGFINPQMPMQRGAMVLSAAPLPCAPNVVALNPVRPKKCEKRGGRGGGWGEEGEREKGVGRII